MSRTERRVARASALPVALTVLAVAVAVAVPRALAGQWVQVSCVNPSGSAAPSQGWGAGRVDAGGWPGELRAVGGARVTLACHAPRRDPHAYPRLKRSSARG